MSSTLEGLLKKLKSEDEFYTKETVVIEEETNKIDPDYEVLCKDYSNTVKDYTETRDLVICLLLFFMPNKCELWIIKCIRFFILDTKKTNGNVELKIKKTQAKVQHLMDSRVKIPKYFNFTNFFT